MIFGTSILISCQTIQKVLGGTSNSISKSLSRSSSTYVSGAFVTSSTTNKRTILPTRRSSFLYKSLYHDSNPMKRFIHLGTDPSSLKTALKSTEVMDKQPKTPPRKFVNFPFEVLFFLVQLDYSFGSFTIKPF